MHWTLRSCFSHFTRRGCRGEGQPHTIVVLASGLLCSLAFPQNCSSEPYSLKDFWPVSNVRRGWDLVESDNPLNLRMTVANTPSEDGFLMWFFNKTGQKPGNYDLERFRLCENTGHNQWLWLDSYLNFDERTGELDSHSIQSTEIVFTPGDGSQSYDLIGNGTYDRCGGAGQPYLISALSLTSYRIQAWGTINKIEYPNRRDLWYWDATVHTPHPVEDPCNPGQFVTAIKVDEAWWQSFQDQESGWTPGASGEVDEEGIPTGEGVRPFRTVWHAESGFPYFAVSNAQGTSTWCTAGRWKLR